MSSCLLGYAGNPHLIGSSWSPHGAQISWLSTLLYVLQLLLHALAVAYPRVLHLPLEQLLFLHVRCCCSRLLLNVCFLGPAVFATATHAAAVPACPAALHLLLQLLQHWLCLLASVADMGFVAGVCVGSDGEGKGERQQQRGSRESMCSCC